MRRREFLGRVLTGVTTVVLGGGLRALAQPSPREVVRYGGYELIPTEYECAALSIPFAELPSNLYIRGQRYLVVFDRLELCRKLTHQDFRLLKALPAAQRARILRDFDFFAYQVTGQAAPPSLELAARCEF